MNVHAIAAETGSMYMASDIWPPGTLIRRSLSLFLDEGQLLHNVLLLLLYILLYLREELLQLCHANKTAGYFGILKTLHPLLLDYWWPHV